jgi:hypothetical protein
MSEKTPRNEAIYALQNYDIDFIKVADDKVIKAHMSDLGLFEHEEVVRQYESEYEAITKLCGDLVPESFYPYLEKMMGRTPTWDSINNTIFIGNPNGRWDHRERKYKHARELGMEAVDDYELALVETVQETIKALRTFVK